MVIPLSQCRTGALPGQAHTREDTESGVKNGMLRSYERHSICAGDTRQRGPKGRKAGHAANRDAVSAARKKACERGVPQAAWGSALIRQKANHRPKHTVQLLAFAGIPWLDENRLEWH